MDRHHQSDSAVNPKISSNELRVMSNKAKPPDYQVLTIVRRPEVRLETRSLPALAQTMVLWAPDTAGPWSAVTIRHISTNWQAYLGNLGTDTTPVRDRTQMQMFVMSPVSLELR